MARRKKTGTASKFLKLVSVLIVGVAIGVVVVTVFFRETQPDKSNAPANYAPKPPITDLTPQVPSVKPPDVPPVVTLPPEIITPSLPRLAVVIDDMGQDIGKLNDILNIGAPITIAVLPHLKHSTQTANDARAKGLDVLLHLPMEPQLPEKNDPGKGALWTAMTPAEIRAQIDKDFSSVPNAIGVNNHMGSKFTEDQQLMAEVMVIMKKKNLFFLDSKTTSKSVAANTARKAGVDNIDRNVFLDNIREVPAIKKRIAEAIMVAKRHGSAVAIGHPYPETITALKEFFSETRPEGVEIAKISDVLRSKKGPHGSEQHIATKSKGD